MRENKAITLIALVVTIIVLIILAGVSINLVLGDNGIVTKAKLARENRDKAQEIESNILASYEYEMEHIASARDSIQEALLFPVKEDGTSAHEIEQEYTLNSSYKNYKYLLVEAEYSRADSGWTGTATMWIPTSNIIVVDSFLQNATSHSTWSVFCGHDNHATFYFNSDTSFKLCSATTSDTKITHIYGIN